MTSLSTRAFGRVICDDAKLSMRWTAGAVTMNPLKRVVRIYLFINSRFSGPFIPKGYVDPPYMTAY